MNKPHSIIYITGLGDTRGSKNISLQKIATWLWRIFGVKTIFFQMNWASRESFSKKLSRLLKAIDRLSANGDRISLVGVSAGASAALAGFAQRKETVSGVVFICGKLARPETVNPSYYTQNPAFQGAMDELKPNLGKLTTSDKQKLLSIRPLYDQTVSVSDTKINGVRQRIIPIFYHAPAIAAAITIFSPIVVFFLKQRAKIK